MLPIVPLPRLRQRVHETHESPDSSLPGPFFVSLRAVRIETFIGVSDIPISSRILFSLHTTSFFKPSMRGDTIPAGTGDIKATHRAASRGVRMGTDKTIRLSPRTSAYMMR